MGRTIENAHWFPGFLKPSHKEIVDKMRPSPAFTHGFLGVDERLEDVIAKDEALLKELGVSYEAIAASIEALFLSDDEFYNGHFIYRKEFIHSPVCPWEDFCSVDPFDLSTKVTEILLLNPGKYERILHVHEEHNHSFPLNKYPDFVGEDLFMVFSDIHPHLIRDHHFFEGEHTPYRVDPRRAIRYLGISADSPDTA